MALQDMCIYHLQHCTLALSRKHDNACICVTPILTGKMPKLGKQHKHNNLLKVIQVCAMMEMHLAYFFFPWCTYQV